MKTGTVNKKKLGEPDSHAMMRHAKTILILLLISAIIATISLFLFFRPVAYLAALAVPVLFLGLVFVSYLERQSRASMLRSLNQTTISKEEIEMDVQYAGISTAMVLTLLFSLAALIVAAATVEDWSMLGMVAAVLFFMSLIIILPYISLFISESAHDERDKLQREAKLPTVPKV
jgi:hypothetical protein